MLASVVCFGFVVVVVHCDLCMNNVFCVCLLMHIYANVHAYINLLKVYSIKNGISIVFKPPSKMKGMSVYSL